MAAPKTKREYEVMAMSKCLPGITPEQDSWAKQYCLNHLGYANKSRAFCLDCGEDFPLDIIKRKRAKCPCCGTSLKIEFTQKTTWDQESYFATTEVVGDYQVVRNYIIYSYHKKGRSTRHNIQEILQYWIAPNNKVTMVGNIHSTHGFCDSWGGDWSIRKERSYYGYYNRNKYDIHPWKYWPGSDFKAEYRKYGINHKLYGLTVYEAMDLIPKYPLAETILKAGQYELLAYWRNNRGILSRYWGSIKICLRRKYVIKDPRTYFDHLDLLSYFRKDLRSPKYVCPKNLKKDHDRLVAKKREIQLKQEIQRKKEELLEGQKEYAKKIRTFMGLMFQEKNITVKVLETVEEFLVEGDIHKHCLYTNAYHLKKDSLIFSASVDGEPMETVEVSLSQMKVLQARGLHNNPTKHHEAIVKLVSRNMSSIEARVKTLGIRIKAKKRKAVEV